MLMTRDGHFVWGYPTKELVADLKKQAEVQEVVSAMEARATRKAIVEWLEHFKAYRA